MTFFNKKEEVIEVKLTSFGRHKLAKGDFRPASYSFFDDDVVYDSAYGAAGGDAHDRIKMTPRMRTQTNINGAERANETEVDQRPGEAQSSATGDVKIAITVQPTSRADIKQPIGTSGIENQNPPAWRALMLQGELDSSATHFENNDQTIAIPQMNVKKREFTIKAIGNTDDNTRIYGEVLPDGSSITLEEGEDSEFLLFLGEKNADSLDKNFSMELYQVSTEAGQEKLSPLLFKKNYEYSRIVDGILMEIDEAPNPDLSIDEVNREALVNHYFEISADREIDPAIIQKALAGKRFADLRDLETFANMFTTDDGETNRFNTGRSASDLYNLSLEDIANMSKEVLEDMRKSAEDLYDNGDNTDEC
tara:strand:+ start:115 stop:1206 length:1092 start_codon:yes stop_codon:yes gene_type:complete